MNGDQQWVAVAGERDADLTPDQRWAMIAVAGGAALRAYSCGRCGAAVMLTPRAADHAAALRASGLDVRIICLHCITPAERLTWSFARAPGGTEDAQRTAAALRVRRLRSN